MAHGVDIADMSEEERKPLVKWLAAFCLIRLVERSTEGIHSLIAKILKKCPAAGLSYISMELRFETLELMALSHPDVTSLVLTRCVAWTVLEPGGTWS